MNAVGVLAIVILVGIVVWLAFRKRQVVQVSEGSAGAIEALRAAVKKRGLKNVERMLDKRVQTKSELMSNISQIAGELGDDDEFIRTVLWPLIEVNHRLLFTNDGFVNNLRILLDQHTDYFLCDAPKERLTLRKMDMFLADREEEPRKLKTRRKTEIESETTQRRRFREDDDPVVEIRRSQVRQFADRAKDITDSAEIERELESRSERS